jgi:hypothetical protein
MKVCDDDIQPNDGYTTFDIPSFIGGIADATINYYTNGNYSQLIPNPSSFTNMVTGSQTIYLKITHTSGCVKYRTLTLQVLPIPTPQTNPLPISACDTNNDGFETVDLTTNLSYITNGNTSLTLHYFYTQNDAIVGLNEISTPYQANVNGDIWIRVESSFSNSYGQNCYTLVEQPIQINPFPILIGNGYTLINDAGNQTLTVNVEGNGTYAYQLDDGPTQTNNVFYNVSLGIHTVTVWGTAGFINTNCSPLVLSNIEVNLTGTLAPTGNTSQSFSPGATLADIQVTGQNIQWYSNSTGSFVGGNTAMNALPVSTTLVDNTTYYASQKIGGYESTTRLPVTVHLVLNNATFEHNSIRFSPNPVKDKLQLENTETIDAVYLYSLSGQKVITTFSNTSTPTIDLSGVASGIYFVKVISNHSSQIFKIVKE